MGVVDETTLATRRDWAVAHDRRVHATRISRRLQPAAVLLGGYASSRLRVCLAGERERRPAAALALGEPPQDGVARAAPLLVVELAPAGAAWWLGAGTRVVWVLDHRCLVVHRPAREPLALAAHDEVAVPRAADLRLPVKTLLPKARLVQGYGG